MKISCSLSEEGLKNRQSTTFEQLFSNALEKQPLHRGYRFRIAATDQVLRRITEMIIEERACCPFLAFTVHVNAAEGPVWFDMTGPEGTKEFLDTLIV